ncbi:TraM recognition domain-containing protein [Agromyces mariniharenae]|nr:TraM recognition domain-containing protein [Agromyces mariniharenae]
MALAGVGVVAALIIAQAGTAWALAVATSKPVAHLSIWQLLGLYAQPDPTIVTGQPVPGAVHWGLVALAVALMLLPVVLWLRQRRGSGLGETLRKGTASKAELKRHAGGPQLVRRATTLRPSIDKKTAKPEEVGYCIGAAHGLPIWMSVEDSAILIGPSRSGKGFNFVVPMLTKAMGAVVTTSTRADNLLLTMEHRKRAGGPMFVFDPAGVAAGAGNELRWSPLEGANDLDIAMRRLASLIPSDGFDGVQNTGYWEATSKKIILALFHAAALDERTIDDFWRWMSDPNLAKTEALEILNSHPDSDRATARSLNAVLTGSPEQRGNDWAAAYADVAYMASPKVRASMSPTAEDAGFDPFEFIMSRGTLYLIGDAASAAAFEPLIVALVEEISAVAQGIAGASPDARLDPPVQFILDEAANFRIPTLPKLISYSGGSGLTVIVVLQSISQAEMAWGRDGARALWGAASLKIVLPGGSDPSDLKDLETLVGEVELERRTFSTSESGVSYQHAREEKRVLRASEIRTLAFGTALVFFRQLKPAIVKLTPWIALPIAEQLKTDRDMVAARLSAASPYAARLRRWNERNPG